MPSYLVTGSSRGLGLAFVTELVKNPENHVIATARNPTTSKALTELVESAPKGKLDIVQLDVSEPSSITEAVTTVSKLLPNGLDAFLSNAGADLQPIIPFEQVDLVEFDKELHFMVSGTLGLLRAFLPLIRQGQGKKILAVSSIIGSIDQSVNLPGLNDQYAVTRAALNMLIRKWGAVLKNEGISTATIHPGWVPSTEIGDGISPWMAKYAPEYPKITTEEAAAGVVKVLTELNIEQTGSFFNYDGTTLPW